MCIAYIHAMFQALYLIERKEWCEDVAFLSYCPPPSPLFQQYFTTAK